MAKSTKVVWAAGGVVWRTAGDLIGVCVAHRPHYDDWTLPKGKGESGETLISTAVREIAEETGYTVRLGRHLNDVSYDLGKTSTGKDKGRKHVRYWSAEYLGGTFEANHEVDEVRWLAADKAEALLSYRLDKEILQEFLRLPAALTTLLLVRHATAGKKSQYDGDDRLRPLDKYGRAQADALVDLLGAFGVEELHAADRVRCRQTLEPFAADRGFEIHTEPTLSEEAYRADPKAAHKRIRAIADSAGRRAVCSQGKVIPPLMEWWAERDGITLPDNENRKGSIWVLSLDAQRLVAADHICGPMPDL